jgi:phosphoribosylformylglycinamidine synthase
MKARVYVSFKPTVLDPQGQTIRGALNGLGHRSVAEVRQGKFFEIEVAPEVAAQEAAGAGSDRATCWRTRIRTIASSFSTKLLDKPEQQLCVELSVTSVRAKPCRSS